MFPLSTAPHAGSLELVPDHHVLVSDIEVSSIMSLSYMSNSSVVVRLRLASDGFSGLGEDDSRLLIKLSFRGWNSLASSEVSSSFISAGAPSELLSLSLMSVPKTNSAVFSFCTILPQGPQRAGRATATHQYRPRCHRYTFQCSVLASSQKTYRLF